MSNASVILLNEVIRMISGKKKLLWAAIGAAAVVASPALAYMVHYKAAASSQGYGAYHVVGTHGKLIGVAPNSRIRFQLQQEGLPH